MPALGVDVVVVETLGDEYQVGDAEVNGESNDGRDKVCPDCAWRVSVMHVIGLR